MEGLNFTSATLLKLLSRPLDDSGYQEGIYLAVQGCEPQSIPWSSGINLNKKGAMSMSFEVSMQGELDNSLLKYFKGLSKWNLSQPSRG